MKAVNAVITSGKRLYELGKEREEAKKELERKSRRYDREVQGYRNLINGLIMESDVNDLVSLIKELDKAKEVLFPAECIQYLLQQFSYTFRPEVICKEDPEFEAAHSRLVTRVLYQTKGL